MDFSDRPHAQRAVDPRPARTRAAIIAAIDRLGSADAEVTVAAIVAEAQVSRSSFYSQFRDLDDVGVQLMNELFRDIKRVDAELRRSHQALKATSTSLDMFLAESQRRRGLYTTVLGGNVSSDARRVIHEIVAQGVLASASHSAPRSVDPHIASTFVAAGLLAVFTDWLVAENPVSASQLRAQLIAVLPPWVTGSQTAADRV
ncbi:TetR/AcrR family transcriptional regulator [Leucobacter sp. W1478]|uniref:TetR/AcrR family transcriptional regulator n=1 Tax=Leucobacter sp. W1478 TaxID=3439065 RepID=UPI003F3D6201